MINFSPDVLLVLGHFSSCSCGFECYISVFGGEKLINEQLFYIYMHLNVCVCLSVLVLLIISQCKCWYNDVIFFTIFLLFGENCNVAGL